jgi:hypothetical protein
LRSSHPHGVVPLQNRVTPLGELIATPARGLVFGNRGRLHDDERRIRRRFVGRRWIGCRLEFRGRYHGAMPPGRYTGLFFLDEATAFAAGHRPCAECRHDDYVRLVEICAARADAIDARLHEERLGPRRERALDELPEGAFVLRDGEPWLVLGDELLRWTPGGYTQRVARPGGRAIVITPPLLVKVLHAGWAGVVPFLHGSASRAASRKR